MWVTRNFDRARRRFRAPPPLPAHEPADGVVVGDLTVSLVRGDLDRVVRGLAAVLGPEAPKPDSPVRLAAALATMVEQAGGTGRPVVTRSPAGLYTPEFWHIRVEGADGRTRDAVNRLIAGGRVG